MLVAERADFHAPGEDGAERDTVAHQRHGERGAVPDDPLCHLRLLPLLVRFGGQVVDMDGALLEDRAAGERTARKGEFVAHVSRMARGAGVADHAQLVSLDAKNPEVVGLA